MYSTNNASVEENSAMVLEVFRKRIETDDAVAQLRAGLIGEGAEFMTPFGKKTLTYADYTASGRALRQVEDFVAEHVLPYYANSHTEASFCGAYTTGLREEARALIASEVNAGPDCSVIFSGSGATSAVNRLVALCGIAGETDKSGTGKPVVFIGPYEHHSNILPWRESGAEVIEIDEADGGGPDLTKLEYELRSRTDRPLLVGAFSAASNVTGILTDVDAVTRLLKRYGALAFWDYAGGGPYLTMDMDPEPGLEKDAIFLSPHKFPGGPGASGLLIIRNSVVRATRPTWPGGGSVAYVSPWAHDYLESVIEREEAGTPNVIGDIRAALAFIVKASIGPDFIAKRDRELCARAMAVWSKNPHINILAADHKTRLPIFSFTIRDNKGGHLHHELVTKMLSDIAGIQVRGGCVCAGPYGHRLLGVGRHQSETIRAEIRAGNEIEKPGWVRLNFSYLMDDEKADYIIDNLDQLAHKAPEISRFYVGNKSTAKFEHQSDPDYRAQMAGE
jgi:selenocysteine lyase/cysteine desulfurase